jgi:hypothetical protein
MDRILNDEPLFMPMIDPKLNKSEIAPVKESFDAEAWHSKSVDRI